jgi:hypothetical protein
MINLSIYGITKGLEVISLSNHISSNVLFQDALIEITPNQITLKYNTDVFRIFKKRINNQNLIWIGLYRGVNEIGYSRVGGFYGAGIWLLEATADPRQIIPFLCNLADQIKDNAIIGNNFIKQISEIKNVVDFHEKLAELEKGLKLGSKGLSIDSKKTLFFTSISNAVSIIDWLQNSTASEFFNGAFIGSDDQFVSSQSSNQFIIKTAGVIGANEIIIQENKNEFENKIKNISMINIESDKKINQLQAKYNELLIENKNVNEEISELEEKYNKMLVRLKKISQMGIAVADDTDEDDDKIYDVALGAIIALICALINAFTGDKFDNITESYLNDLISHGNNFLFLFFWIYFLGSILSYLFKNLNKKLYNKINAINTYIFFIGLSLSIIIPSIYLFIRHQFPSYFQSKNVLVNSTPKPQENGIAQTSNNENENNQPQLPKQQQVQQQKQPDVNLLKGPNPNILGSNLIVDYTLKSMVINNVKISELSDSINFYNKFKFENNNKNIIEINDLSYNLSNNLKNIADFINNNSSFLYKINISDSNPIILNYNSLIDPDIIRTLNYIAHNYTIEIDKSSPLDFSKALALKNNFNNAKISFYLADTNEKIIDNIDNIVKLSKLFNILSIKTIISSSDESNNLYLTKDQFNKIEKVLQNSDRNFIIILNNYSVNELFIQERSKGWDYVIIKDNLKNIESKYYSLTPFFQTIQAVIFTDTNVDAGFKVKRNNIIKDFKKLNPELIVKDHKLDLIDWKN